MSQQYDFVLTRTARDLIMGVPGEIGRVEIATVAVGEASYDPATDADGWAMQTALQAERQRTSDVSGERTAPHVHTLGAVIDGPGEMWIREIGLIDPTGRLLAVSSRGGQSITYKTPQAAFALVTELVFASLPADTIALAPGAGPLDVMMTGDLAAIAASLADLHRRCLDQGLLIRNLTDRLDTLTQQETQT